ncbi:linear amide C-N hydrolase [Alkaliphilus peptidifermentans]|uniref:Choloylglycine hydrolase n=1 Tax=Alkaliphilus peptidifermentans DSM 18978 TaxID=1120976 RepID=A0A1G5EAR3_9FIRM|nr:linear amide C-N hydrolase [Alkaliphilus peptidifermentans]SCY23588.1 choloylglycine hydrolase [Alkaliphilus peptidifermentans DSM 18978]
MCTEFILPGQKNIKVSGRTMDYTDDLHSKFVIVPRETRVQSFIDGDEKNFLKEGMRWESDYGFVGISVFNMPFYADGLNEKGLSAALLVLGGTQYPKPCKCNDKNIPMVYLLQYILGKCKDIEDIKKILPQVTICGLLTPLRFFNDFHLIAHDANGDSIVLEAENSQINQYHNEGASVLTINPFLHWHLKNLKNYRNLNNNSQDGSSLHGLPGDSTSSSRFVRTSLLRKYSSVSQNINQEIQQAFYIINRVTLVNGEKSHEGGVHITQYEVVRDHKNKKYYFRSNQNQSIRVLNFEKIDFSGKTKYDPIPITTGTLYEEILP